MNISIEEAVGNLILGKVPGSELDQDSADCLRKGIMSGVTIFSENVASQSQLIDLTNAVYASSRSPAIIACDQEGGAVQRLDKIVSPIPSMMALGQLDDKERTQLVLGLAAKQMRTLGINCVFAPVADINTNPLNPIIGTRAFGSDPDLVSRMSGTALKSYLEAGVLPVAKHFPGHGDSDVDSHLSLPKLKHGLERLQEIELLPFRENILLSPAIMVAHLWIQALDSEILPASMSEAVITKLLRHEMGFSNLLFSDDMLMKAIGNTWGLEEACVRAIHAGLDQVLVCSNPDDVRRVHQALVKAVKDGRINEDRIESANKARQVALKKLPERDEFDKSKRIAILEKSIRASDATLIDTSMKAIEFSRGVPRDIFAGSDTIHIVQPDLERYRLNFKDALIAEIPNMEDRLVEIRFKYKEVNEEIARQIASGIAGKCILFTFRAVLDPGQKQLADQLKSASGERLLVACDLPYDLNIIEDWENAVSIFDPSDLAVRAFAKLIAKHLKSDAIDSGCQHCGH